eukprot:gene16182-7548_t
MFPQLLKTFNAGQGQTAWVGSLASASLFFFSMLSVKLCDVTCVSFTCLLGSILGGTGLILTSTAGSLETLYATHSFLFGLGTSLMYTPSLVIVARWYDQWRSIATGFVVASGSLGQVVLSPLLHFLMESYGVLDTFRWWGVIFMVTTVLSSTSFYLLDRRDSKESTKQSGISKYSIKWTLLRDKAYVTWLIIMMICNFTYYIPLIHLSKYAVELGAQPQASSLLLAAIAASAMIGRVFFGKISNFRPEITIPLYQFAMFFSGVITLFSSMATKFWHLLLYSILYGFLDGSFIGLISIVTMQIVGLDDLAQGWGIVLFSIAAPIALGPPTVGWMNESNSVEGRALFYLSGVPMIAGACLMFLVRLWQKNKKKDICNNDLVEEEQNTMYQFITSL